MPKRTGGSDYRPAGHHGIATDCNAIIRPAYENFYPSLDSEARKYRQLELDERDKKLRGEDIDPQRRMSLSHCINSIC
jgi:hypothetical protein